MSTPAEVVQDVFSAAEDYANNALSDVDTFTAALAGAIIPDATLEISWEAVTPPSTVGAPSRPASLEEIEDELTFDADGSIIAAMPGELTAEAPNIDIDEFDEPDPTVDFGTAPVLVFDDAPTINIGTAPVVPEIEDVEIPDAPTITLPDAPTYLALNTPTFAGVDLNPEFLANLEEVPTLDLVAPTPYSHSIGENYESELLTTLSAVLVDRLAGGTGLDESVETAIWDRMRDREAAIAQADMDEVQRTNEALGFQLPTGVLAAQLRESQRNYYNKVSGASREISIEQAKLEQENLKTAIAEGIQLEGKLIDHAFRLEQLAFDHSKYVAENAISIYNGQVDKFKGDIAAYQSYATAYRAIIDGELAKVEVFKAEVQAELAKAETNRTLVEQYKAEIEARMATVRIYEAQIQGARARMDLEGARIAAVGEQIKAYIATINGETAKVEAYKVGVQAQAVQVEAYKTGVEAQLATVEVYKAKAQAFNARVGAQAEEARAQTSYYLARVEAYKAEWGGWQARVSAESERIKAISIKSGSALDGYRADIVRYQAQIQQNVEYYRASISQYEGQRNYTLAAEKLNTEIVRANKESILDAAKTGAQVYAQLAAAALSRMAASASVTAGSNNTVSYGYSNQTDSSPASVTVI